MVSQRGVEANPYKVPAILEMMPPKNIKDVQSLNAEFTTKENEEERLAAWMIWTDGSSNQRARGVRVLLQSPKGNTIECVVHLQLLTTNNEAKYEAVLSGLDLAKTAMAMLVVIHCDSQVVIRHINSDYEAKGEWMREYMSMIKGKVSEGLSVKFVQIPKEENEQVDRLAKAASAECMVVTNQVLSFVQYSYH